MQNAPDATSPAPPPPVAGNSGHGTAKKSWLPAIDSPGYYILLGLVAIFILGPLGGITATYMNFSLGFFVGGQVLAGILGSVVTYGYGAEGKHGANYMQTMAASVASTAAMAVLIQAMVWLGMPQPPVPYLILYFTCIGMFGCGVGMLYTPILVDRMQLMYPSGFAVANILRALTDVRLLKQSIARLGSGTLIGLMFGINQKWAQVVSLPFRILHIGGPNIAMDSPWGTMWTTRVAQPISEWWVKRGELIDSWSLDVSTVGAGMVVGARIGIPAAVMGFIGSLMTPYFVKIGWLEEGQPFRKITFIIALGMILGAAAVDMTLIGVRAFAKFSEQAAAKPEVEEEEWKKTNNNRLFAWTAFWGVAVIAVANTLFNVPIVYACIAIGLAFIFVMINGISTGISDSNPISSAFVITVFILAACGLKDGGVALICAGILLLSTSSGVDMQQDRSTGWRLGTNRTIQFRFQVIGITMGAIVAVGLAWVFMKAYPALTIDQFAHHGAKGTEKWGSVMTYKFVGAIRQITNPKPFIFTAMWLGIAIGFCQELFRKIIKGNKGYQDFVAASPEGKALDFLFDTFALPSPYASSFGGFLELPVSLWFAAGGVFSSLYQSIEAWLGERKKAAATTKTTADELPEDMSTTALVGGGLIAGASLAALAIGMYSLWSQGALGMMWHTVFG